MSTAPPRKVKVASQAAKLAVRTVPGVGEAAMAVDAALQASTVMRERMELDRDLRKRRKAASGILGKAQVLGEGARERLIQQISGNARIAAAALTGFRTNPLTGWDSGGIRASAVHTLFRILTSPRSRAHYEEALRNVPFNLNIVVVAPGADEDLFEVEEYSLVRLPKQKLRARARREKQVVLYVGTNLPKDFDAGDKWMPGREAIYTPFMLLHRLFDTAYATTLYTEHRNIRDRLQEISFTVLDVKPPVGVPRTKWIERIDKLRWFPEGARPNACNLGVDTAAGRHSALADGEQTLADLFAKYCLTGRVAFDPTALPPGVTQAELDHEDREDLKRLRDWMRVREAGKTEMRALFEELIAILKEGDAFLV